MSKRQQPRKNEPDYLEMLETEEEVFEETKRQTSAAIAQQTQKANQEQEKLNQVVEATKRAIYTHTARIGLLKELAGISNEEALPPESTAEG